MKCLAFKYCKSNRVIKYHRAKHTTLFATPLGLEGGSTEKPSTFIKSWIQLMAWLGFNRGSLTPKPTLVPICYAVQEPSWFLGGLDAQVLTAAMIIWLWQPGWELFNLPLKYHWDFWGPCVWGDTVVLTDRNSPIAVTLGQQDKPHPGENMGLPLWRLDASGLLKASFWTEKHQLQPRTPDGKPFALCLIIFSPSHIPLIINMPENTLLIHCCCALLNNHHFSSPGPV